MLTNRERVFFERFKSLANESGEIVIPKGGCKELAKLTKMPNGTVCYRAIGKLLEEGLVSIVQKAIRGKPAIYTISSAKDGVTVSSTVLEILRKSI